jgi:hypothetical protein
MEWVPQGDLRGGSGSSALHEGARRNAGSDRGGVARRGLRRGRDADR